MSCEYVHYHWIDQTLVGPFEAPFFVHQIQPLTNPAPSATVRMTSQGSPVSRVPGILSPALTHTRPSGRVAACEPFKLCRLQNSVLQL